MKLKMTSKEKRELLLEILFTLVLLLAADFAIYILLNEWTRHIPGVASGIFDIKMSLTLGPNTVKFGNWGLLFVFIATVFDSFILYWRIVHQYRQIQLYHVISELHYIASGHFDHRIPFVLNGSMQRVVESINALVDSTVESMKEERRIEKSKDELITNVSHDIRTPLTSIIGYLGLIEDRQFHSQEDLLKYTHTAYVKAKQMKLLVDDLFEYTKVRQPSVPIHTTTFDMAQLIEQLAADFELEAKKINMQIQVKANPASLMMEGDTEKLVRVFNNLLSNALKYGKGGHHIVMEVDKVGTEAIIAVRNDGPAIPKHSLDQLFDRFYRVEESRSQETGGTGLGLAIAQSIVALHGGYIYAKSDQKWTSFIIHLPLQRTNKKSES